MEVIHLQRISKIRIFFDVDRISLHVISIIMDGDLNNVTSEPIYFGQKCNKGNSTLNPMNYFEK
jgi:hypothetical protein